MIGKYMHLIMFDLDGTLLKSNNLDINCFCSAFRNVMGIEIESDWTDFKYFTDEGIVSEILTRHLNRPALKNEILSVRSEILNLLQTQAITNKENFVPIPGAIELICSLKNNWRCGIAIATGCWEESAILKLSTAGFDVENLPIASSDDSHRREEIMDIAYTQSLDLWSVSKFETVTYIGDGVWDLKASKSMGYHFIGIGYDNNGAQLRQAGASYILNDYTDEKEFYAKMYEIWKS